MHILKKIPDYLLGILFPKKCITCGGNGSFLCDQCFGKFPPSPSAKQSFIFALFDYQHPSVKRAIWKFKYGNIRELAQIFGEALYEEIIADLSEGLNFSKKQSFLIVPIPLHPERLRERGYNQSELIVRELLKKDQSNLFEFSPKALTRIRRTKPQAKSDKRAVRLKNLEGAFSGSPELVNGKDVILVDDVTTTGATLSEARKALLASSARSVRAYVIAH